MYLYKVFRKAESAGSDLRFRLYFYIKNILRIKFLLTNKIILYILNIYNSEVKA